jgi:hypothetical protein
MHEKEIGKNNAIPCQLSFYIYDVHFQTKKYIFGHLYSFKICLTKLCILKHLTKYVSMLDKSQILHEYYSIWVNLFYGSMDIA